MSNFAPELVADLDSFKRRVYDGKIDILDPPEVHHEFVSGTHGRKLDFDKIETYSDAYIQFTALFARVISSIYSGQRLDALVGVASGANRLSESIAPLLGERVLALTTKREDYGGKVRLDERSVDSVDTHRLHRDLVVIIDDVGTTGGTAASVVSHLREYDIKTIEAVNFWQRSPNLPAFDRLGINYLAAIDDVLPMFTPDGISIPEGYIAENVRVIPYERND